MCGVEQGYKHLEPQEMGEIKRLQQVKAVFIECMPLFMPLLNE